MAGVGSDAWAGGVGIEVPGYTAESVFAHLGFLHTSLFRSLLPAESAHAARALPRTMYPGTSTNADAVQCYVGRLWQLGTGYVPQDSTGQTANSLRCAAVQCFAVFLRAICHVPFALDFSARATLERG